MSAQEDSIRRVRSRNVDAVFFAARPYRRHYLVHLLIAEHPVLGRMRVKARYRYFDMTVKKPCELDVGKPYHVDNLGRGHKIDRLTQRNVCGYKDNTQRAGEKAHRKVAGVS